ncbi:MAG: TetR/AcrR family transcriptional regulator [Lachnospiraceae bacterium]|nr:TetR/AcrR family transcriptional regulator [Lachnospiraceae bacterium]
MKKSDKTELTVTKIIETALNEFGKNGYTGGTINNICKTGINKGLIYHNFKGKDDLYLTCLNLSCKKLIQHIREQGVTEHPEIYLTARMDTFSLYPDEAHIFFEALLSPPAHLIEEIIPAISEFTILNEQMVSKMLDAVTLRDTVARDDAVSYFHMIQTMLNGYFSSPAFYNTALEEKMELHEKILPQLLDFMLYGIAKGDH